ncbi:MAG: aryl-sulfate sulfotransferase, partial [Saprospiraceae bacterium]|nr:aryl-sulfate sulfotransferase [Saprospiraceae bacterium]
MNLIQANKDFTAVGIFQRLFSFIGCLCSIYHSSVAQIQNTVGVLQAQPLEYTSGYDLLYPNNQADIFLIDQCGRLVHRWQDDPSWRPGNVAYLLENGQLVRAKRYFAAINDPIWFSGGGEMVELVDWSGNVLWQFYQNDSLKRLHHDIQPLPNGHVLLVSWELKTGEEALLQGRDPASLLENRLFPDYILEVSPDSGDSVLWEWHAWDHLIQDFDETKPNYGVIAEHPELIDLNFDTREGIPDWLHINSIDYHPQLDQIMLSVLGFDEIWIIDHSTTSEEAAGHVGGRSGQGGDLLYRWGNPMAYQQGDVSDQMLFGQHDAHWVDDLAGTDPFYGQIAVFDNNYRPEFSAGHLIDASFDTLTQSYLMDQGRWLPISYT